MEHSKVDTLLESLLEATLRLEQAVIREESDPVEWVSSLDERERLVDKLQEEGIVGAQLSDSQKRQLLRCQEINDCLVSRIEQRKQGIQLEINNVQRIKHVRHMYNDDGPSGYGAFIDRKK